MPLDIHTHIHIQTPPDKVWDVLIDFSRYPDWNPFIRSLEGEPVRGTKLKANINGMKFKPTVLSSVPNKEFVWLGNFLLPGIFDGKHIFTLKERKDGTTDFYQSESFKGILVPLFKGKMEKDTIKGFNNMNEKLKERVESLN